jgi:hypothetical protein
MIEQQTLDKLDRLTELVENMVELTKKMLEKNGKTEEQKLTTKEAARLLGRKEQTLLGWRLKKINLPFYKEGGRYYYLKSEVLKYLENR